MVVGKGEKPGRQRRGQHHRSIDDAATVLVGPDAEDEPQQGAGEDRRADQQPELGVVEAGSFLIWTPTMEKIVHTAKQTVKAIVELHRARWRSSVLASALGCMADS
jgi:dihydroxyacetone kinase